MDQPFFFFFLALIRVPLDAPDLRRRTTTLAIVDTSGIIALDVVGIAGPLTAVYHNCVKLAPLVDVIDIRPGQSDHQSGNHCQRI